MLTSVVQQPKLAVQARKHNFTSHARLSDLVTCFTNCTWHSDPGVMLASSSLS